MNVCRAGRSQISARTFAIYTALLVVAATNVGAALSIPGGIDCWTTAAGTTVQVGPFAPGNFTAAGRTSLAVGVTALPVGGVPLPPNTCACTAPIIQWTDPHGSPVNPGDQHAVNQTVIPNTNDTCVTRGAGNVTALGIPTPVGVTILALHLQGSLSVPMNTGAPCTYTVNIQLNGSQAGGSMSLTPTKLPDLSHGTVDLSSLPVGAQVTFTPTSGCDPHNAVPANTTFANTTGVYQVAGVSAVPALSPLGMALLAGGLLVVAIVILRRRARMNVA